MERGAVWIMVLCAASLLHSAASMTHTVGGAKGWTMSSISTTFYNDWAAKQTFNVDDDLLFVYGKGTHNVWVVTPDEASKCSTLTAVEKYEDANATIKLYRSGEFGFLCEYPGHCSGGMKMRLTVAEAPATAGPAPAPDSGMEPADAPEEPSPSEESSPVDEETPDAAASLQSLSALVSALLFACLAFLIS